MKFCNMTFFGVFFLLAGMAIGTYGFLCLVATYNAIGGSAFLAGTATMLLGLVTLLFVRSNRISTIPRY